LQNGATFAGDHPATVFANSASLQSSAGAGAVVDNAQALNPPAALTVAAWVRLTSSAGEQPIAAKAANGQGYGIYVRDGVLAAEVWDQAGNAHVITSSVVAGSWLHVAMTYKQAGEFAAYINGRQVLTQAVSAGPSASAAPLQMAVTGALDDVRIYNQALTRGGVAALAGGRSCVTPGTTWADAVPDLQCALLDSAAGSEVWVASGIYRPTRGPDRSASFVINDGVAVYGGFAGSETNRDGRQAGTPPPVLSGDIEGNDRVDASGVITELGAITGGNALHVVTVAGRQAATVLERAVVTGGYANGTAAGGCAVACGGGLYLTGGVLQLRNLHASANYATDRGGGVYALQSNALLVGSTFLGNQAAYGGGVFLEDARFQIVNTLLGGNLATGDGGGLYALNTPVRMVNVTAGGNRAGGTGGGLLLGGASSVLNALLGGNAAGNAAAGVQIAGSGATVQNSLIQDGCGPGIVCTDNVQTGDPLFVQPLPPLAAPGSIGDYRVLPQSAAIDQGNNDAGFDPSLPEGATIAAVAVDLVAAPRIVAARALPPRIDLGAYEAANTPPIFLTPAAMQAAINTAYIYDAVAEDPNNPGVRLAIEAISKPQWLGFAMQAGGAGRLQGTPAEKDFGSYTVVLRTTDSLGASSEQSFVLKVKFRLNPVFLPEILLQKK
jgi:hypothetical protein